MVVFGSPGKGAKVGTEELEFVSRSVVHVIVVSGWPAEAVEVGDRLFSVTELVISEFNVSGKAGEPGDVVIAEFVWTSAWVANESAVSGSEKETVKDVLLVLVNAIELVISEVIVFGTSGEVTVVGVAELSSSPVFVVVNSVNFDPLWENVRVFLGTAG